MTELQFMYDMARIWREYEELQRSRKHRAMPTDKPNHLNEMMINAK